MKKMIGLMVAAAALPGAWSAGAPLPPSAFAGTYRAASNCPQYAEKGEDVQFALDGANGLAVTYATHAWPGAPALQSRDKIEHINQGPQSHTERGESGVSMIKDKAFTTKDSLVVEGKETNLMLFERFVPMGQSDGSVRTFQFVDPQRTQMRMTYQSCEGLAYSCQPYGAVCLLSRLDGASSK